jgi:hypothetical protein
MKSLQTLTRVVMVASFLLLTASGVLAGALQSDCEHPIVFRGANLNNYVKQFTGISDPGLPIAEAGQTLALMIQFEGLYSQLGYGPLGYIHVNLPDGEVESCSDELLLARVTGRERGAEEVLKNGSAAMVLSGSFELAGEEIYLISRAEFLRQKRDESVQVPLPTAWAADTALLARLPMRAVTFSPRIFTAEQINTIAEAYLSREVTLYGEPDGSSWSESIDIHEIDGFSYSILDVREDWMLISTGQAMHKRGWVRVVRDIGGSHLREIMPELDCLNAMAIYLQTRVAGPKLSDGRWERHLEGFREFQSSFTEAADGRGDRYALGLLHAMSAILLLESPGAPDETLKSAAQAAAEAAGVLTTNSDAQCLAAATGFAADLRGIDRTDSEGFRVLADKFEGELLRILDLDPLNEFARANLVQLFQLRESVDDLDWQNDAFAKLRKNLEADPQVQSLLEK